MLELIYSQPPEQTSKVFPSSDSSANLEERLEDLERSDRSLYNLIGMEVWTIAKTMDDFYPGFWNQFMVNSRLALKEFIQQKQRPNSACDHFPTNSD